MDICATELGCFWWTWKKNVLQCHLHADKGTCYEGKGNDRVTGPPFCPGMSIIQTFINVSF